MIDIILYVLEAALMILLAASTYNLYQINKNRTRTLDMLQHAQEILDKAKEIDEK